MTSSARSLRLASVSTLVAQPDTSTLARIATLAANTRAQLGGRLNVVGVPPGDPARSYMGAVPTAPAGQPAASIAAAYGSPSSVATPWPQAGDGGPLGPLLTPTQAALLARNYRSGS